MKLSPLQLEAYFLTDLNLQADLHHDPAKPIAFREDDLVVETDVQPLPGADRRWQVRLKIQLQPKPQSNSPYTFSLTVVGFIWAAAQLPADKLEPLVRTNGPSMLYGAAREMVRDLTARGPFPPLSLPSVLFLNQAQPPAEATPQTQAQPSAKTEPAP
jgi:preprotein translocase subunit SecB